MNLLFPFGLALSLSIPLLVLLYVLKIRREEREVASTVLWEQIARDLAAHEPWQRLRVSPLLILQVLLLLFLTAAVTRPAIPVPNRDGFQVILLDGSASMAATDVQPSRFEQAKAEVRKLIEESSDTAESTLVLVSSQPELLVPATPNKVELTSALDRAHITSGKTNVQDALQLARSLVRGRPDGRIYLISDGGFASGNSLDLTGVELVSVGSDGNNRGITQFSARPTVGDSGKYMVFGQVTNFSQSPADSMVVLTADGREIHRQNLTFGPGESASFVYDQIPPGTQSLQARLERPDDLLIDNAAYAVLKAQRTNKVLLVSNGNIFLERALTLLPQIELYRIAPDRYSNDDPDQYDLLVFDNFLPSALPSRGFLAINPPDTALLPIEGTLDRPSVGSWQRDDPVLRYVDFAETRIARANQVTTPGWGRAIAAGEGSPLIIAGSLSGQPVVVTTFDFRQSNLPLQAGFPIFISNIVNFLAGAETGQLPAVHAGEALTIPSDDTTKDMVIKKPDGATETVQKQGTSFTFGRTDAPGVYTVSRVIGDRKVPVGAFASNFLDADESNLKSRASNPSESAEQTIAVPGNREIWAPIVVLALGVLVVEWWWYHRRA